MTNIDHVNDGIVKCDGCGVLAKRRPGHPCPDFWFYIESINRTFSKKTVYVVWACSETCKEMMWNRGPGPKNIDEAASAADRAGR